MNSLRSFKKLDMTTEIEVD